MTTLENENQEEIDNCSRYSLRKWEERVFGTSYEEHKNFFPIAQVKRQTALSSIAAKTIDKLEKIYKKVLICLIVIIFIDLYFLFF